MASSVDGDITLSVAFDTSNIKQDSDKLAKSVQSVFSKYARDSKNANAALLSLQHQMKKCADELNNIRARQKELENSNVYSSEYIKTAQDLARYNQELETTSNKINEIKNKMSALGSTKTVPSEEYAKLNNELTNVESKYNQINQSITDFTDQMTKAGFSAEEIAQNGSMQKLQSQLQSVETEADRLKTKMSQVNQSVEIPVESTNEYKNLNNELVQLQNQYDITSTRANSTKNILESIASSGGVSPGIDTSEYVVAEQRAVGLENELARLKTRYTEVEQSSNKSGSVVKQVFAKAGETVKNAMSKVGTHIKGAFSKLGSAAKNAVGHLKNLKDKAKSSFESVHKSAKSAFSKVLKAVIGLSVLRTIFVKIKQYATDAFSNMAKSVPQVKAEMDSLKASFNQTKNSLATAFQPIFSACIPALTALANTLTRVATTVANFIATLTGQKFIYKAVKANNDLSNSVGGVGDSAKESKKELADYDKLVVISSDDASGAGSGSGGGSSAGGGFEKVATEQSKFAQMIKDAWNKADFTDVGKTIGTKLKGALDSIPWKKIQKGAENAGKSFATLINGITSVDGLFDSAGKTVAEAFNTMFTAIDTFATKLNWKQLGKQLGDFVSSAFFNFDWLKASHTIRTTIGGIATAVSSAADTIKTNMPNIIPKIKEGLEDFINNFPVEEVSQSIADVLDVVINFANELIPDIGSLVAKAGQTVMSTIKKINWKGLGTTVYTAISTAIDTAGELLTEDNFSSILTAIGDLLSNINIPDLLGKMTKLAIDIIKNLAEALKKVNWSEVGRQIGEALKNIASQIPDLVGALLSLAKSILSGLADAFISLSKDNPLGAAFIAIIGGISVGSKCASLAKKLTKNVAAGVTANGSVISGAFGKLFKAGGAVASVVAAAIAGWEIGKWIDSKIGKYTDTAFEMADAAFGGPLSKSRKESARQDTLSDKASIDKNTNEARAAIRNAQSTAEANKIASDSYAELSEKIKVHYSGALAEAEDAELQYKLGLIDETKYHALLNEALKKNSTETNTITKATTELSIQSKLASTEEFKLNTSLKDTSESAKDATKSFSGMPTEAQNAMKKLQEANDTTKKSAEDTAKHYEELYKQKVPTSVQEAQKAQKNLNKSTVDTKKAAEESAKHYEELYKQKVPSSVQEAQKKIKELDADTSKNGESAKASAKHFENLYNKSIASSAKNAAKDVKKSFSDMGKDIKKSSKSASDNSIKSLNKIKTQTDTKSLSNKFQTAFTNINKSATDSKNKLADNFKKTNDNAKTYTLGSSGDGSGGIAGKFKTASAKAVNWFGVTNFTKPFNDKLTNINNNVKTKTLGSNGDGTGGLAGLFKTASAKAVNWFGSTNFTKPFNEKLKFANDNVKTKALGSNGDGTGGLAGLFKTASSKAVSWFNKSNFIDPINGEFTQLNSDANDKANGYNGLSSKFATSSSNIIKNLWGVETEANKNGGIFNQLKTNSIPWLRGLTGAFGTAAENMNNNLKGGINASLRGMQGNSFVSKMLSKVLGTINLITSSFSATPVPLATGAVIPPNKEFLALLGDQKQGVNIETPLDTMIEAFRTALATDGGGNNQPIILQLDGKTIAKVVWDANQRRYKQTGNPMFI